MLQNPFASLPARWLFYMRGLELAAVAAAGSKHTASRDADRRLVGQLALHDGRAD